MTLLGAAAAVWPVAARAQPRERMRRIGVLMNRAAGDREGQTRVATFQETLGQLGWSDSRNVRIDIRWGANIVDLERKYAVELVALAPDVILASGTQSVAALQQITSTLPIVFVGVSDPVSAGFVDNLARPGGNVTGFMLFEYSLSGKWLELLKQIMPGVMRAAVLRDAANPAGIAQFGAIRASATALGVDVSPINVRDAGEIEKAVTAFAGVSTGGLIVTGSPAITLHRALIIDLAARHRLPAVYNTQLFTNAGGLMSYGSNIADQFPRAAQYVDRILKGEKPANLPVQSPTKYDLTINLKTAKALGIDVPSSSVARADKTIE